jgi:hypothetical protein
MFHWANEAALRAIPRRSLSFGTTLGARVARFEIILHSVWHTLAFHCTTTEVALQTVAEKPVVAWLSTLSCPNYLCPYVWL